MRSVIYVSFGQRFGPQNVAVNLLENLLNLKKLTVFGVVDERLTKSSSCLCRKDNIYVPRNTVNLFLTLFIILLRNKPNIFHFNSPPLLLTPLLFLMKIQRIKIVYSFHGGILFENTTRKWLRSLFLIQCKLFYDVIIANSKYSAQFLCKTEKTLGQKVVVIPNGIKVEEQVISTNTLLKGSPAVLYVGRIDYIKGVDILVNSIALVKKSLPLICLHIVGEGTNLGKIKELISHLGLEENVVLHGFIAEKEKNSLYSTSDIVVMPSRNEPFGIIVLEAMRAGKPLIVSNRGALPELVINGHNGLVVNLKQDALAQAIFNLTVDKNSRKTMSENNKITVKSYDWKKITEEYIQLYRTLM
ncbi:MAG: glycosyltransferase family 4 protein [Asgard group archaeon]|nr:glycosyltransferase family 4 protein [Asgard group archaeon]